MDGTAETSPGVAIVDYGMGNLRSVANAFAFCGARPQIVESPGEVGRAEALVLPGVGALGDCVDALRASGFDDFIRGWIGEGRPFFGICLGLQALFERSEEGPVDGLGILPGAVVRFRLPPSFKVPHMGWNAVRFHVAGAALGEGLRDGDQFYFDHTYFARPEDPGVAWGTTDYGGDFTSAVAAGSLFATQFHPEKSQSKGLQIFRNFLKHTRLAPA